jgi:hypothetical protein
VREERRKKKGQVGPGRKEEKERKIKKEGVGRAQLEKEGEKELHSNFNLNGRQTIKQCNAA